MVNELLIGSATGTSDGLIPDSAMLALTEPPRLWSRADVLTRASSRRAPRGLHPTWRSRAALSRDLAQAPPSDGRPGSRQTLASRIRYHYNGNAEGSTLRLTLGCLLRDELGLDLRRVGSGRRLTFTVEGEQRLSAWMSDHALVVWTETPQPWLLEVKLLRELVLPLNLDGNRHHPFRERLSALRKAARVRARAFPVVTR